MLKKAKRLTRRSYRRKLIMFGVSIFASLALTATGFAAWVLSVDAMKDAEGSVEVGAVAEHSVSMSDIGIKKEDGSFVTKAQDENEFKALSVFSFEPREDDDTGMVKNDGENFERMALTYQWTLDNYQVVAEQFILVKIPSTVKQAVTEGYLTLPTAMVMDSEADGYATYKIAIPTQTGTGNAGEDLSWTITNNGTDTKAVFTATLRFGWGEKFGTKNPGVYFDETDGVTKDQAKEQLIRFGATMHGFTYEELKDLDEDAMNAKFATKPLTYFVEVHANVS